VSGAKKLPLGRLEHGNEVLGARALRPKVHFCDFLWKKACIFSPKSDENFPYKYCLPHSLFFIQNEVV